MSLIEEAKPKYLAVVGSTASGKSSLAMTLAETLGGEIVGCDSVQVYRGFDIGSAKPTKEEMERVPHHLFDVVDWHENFDAKHYFDSATKVIEEIRGRGALPIVVGGTGLYLRALWQQSWQDDLPKDEKLREKLSQQSNEDLMEKLKLLDQDRAKQIHLNDKFRLVRAVELVTLLGGPISSVFNETEGSRNEAYVIGMQVERADLLKRISLRTNQMLKDGVIEEVSRLLENGCAKSCKPMQSIGYKQVCDMLYGDLDRNKLKESIEIATRQYAKRQKTWFRKVRIDFNYRPLDRSSNQFNDLIIKIKEKFSI